MADDGDTPGNSLEVALDPNTPQATIDIEVPEQREPRPPRPPRQRLPRGAKSAAALGTEEEYVVSEELLQEPYVELSPKLDFIRLQEFDNIISIPCDTSYVCRLYTVTDQPLLAMSKCYISFLVKDHISCLQIHACASDPHARSLGELETRAVIRFPSASLKSCDVRQASQKCAAGTKELDCYECTVSYDLQHISTENLVVPTPHPALVLLSNHVKTGIPIKVHICGHGKPGSIMENAKALREALQAEQTLNPLDKWTHPTKRRFVIQHNEFIPKENRPQPVKPLDAKCSFFSWPEYVIFMTIGDLEEYEYSKSSITPYESKEHNMYIMSMAGAADRVYLGLLDLPEDDRVRLQPGDCLKVMDENADLETALFARVTVPLPGIPFQYLTVFVSARYDSDNQTFNTGPFSFDAIPYDTNDDITFEMLARHHPVSVRLKIQQDEQSYKHRVAGIAQLQQMAADADPAVAEGQLRQLLLGNNFDSLEVKDIYSPITSIVPEPRQLMGNLNALQEEVIQNCRRAPAGFVVCQGPPGTGKTHLAKAIIAPFIHAWIADSQRKNAVLCCSSSNLSVDSLAVGINAMIRDSEPKGAYMVRVHSADTEMAIAKEKALVDRGQPEGSRPANMQDLSEEENNTLTSMSLATSIHHAYQTQHAHAIAHVPDARVTEESVQLSVGRRILQLIGVIPCGPGDPQKDDSFSGLRENYSQFANGVEFDQNKGREFKTQLKEAREHILSNAVVICTTPALASDAKIYRGCQNNVKLMVIDEAARSTEPEFLPLFAFYYEAVGKVLIGDPRQLPPFAFADADTTYFQKQFKTSLQKRLMKGGFPYVMLNRQYRMCPDIATPISNLNYYGKLIHDDSVLIENRPMAAQLREWNETMFGRKRCVLYLNVHPEPGDAGLDDIGNTGTEQVGYSRYNVLFVQVCINLARKVMDQFPDASVAILTGYNAQYRLYLFAKDKLVASNKKYAKLIIQKIDSAQGMEVDIGIQDLLVRGGPGFLRSKARTNVGGSRWRMGFYLVATKRAIDDVGQRELRQLQSEYIKLGAKCDVEPYGDTAPEWLFDSTFLSVNGLSPFIFSGSAISTEKGQQAVLGGEGEQAAWGGQGEQAAWGGQGEQAAWGGQGEQAASGGQGEQAAWGGQGEQAASAEQAAMGASGSW